MLPRLICTFIVETIHILSSPFFASGLRPLYNKLFSLHDTKVFLLPIPCCIAIQFVIVLSCVVTIFRVGA